MNLNHVSLFVRVVEERSFTKAAAELGMATSSVSRAMMRLEDKLGIRLLQRTTRKLSLTSAGRTYFDQVSGALAKVEEASSVASAMGEEPRGVIRVTTPPSLTGSLLPMLAEFLRQYPKIRVELSFSQRIVDLLEEGCDLALRVGRARDSSLIARRVGNLRGGLFASREYVRRRGQPRKLSELAKHDCVLFRGHGGKATWRLLDGEREHAIEVTGPLDVDEIPAAHQAIVAGIGIGPISFFSSARMTGLVRILPKYTSADLPLSLVSPSKRLEPARVVLLREFLATRFASLRWRA